MKVAIYLLVLCSIFCFTTLKAQEDTASINKLAFYAGRLDPDKTDSVLYYARYINDLSSKISYPYGLTVARRLMGRYYQYKENFDSAIIEFHEYARLAEKYNSVTQQMNALADIAGVYMLTEQYELARKNYFAFLQLSANAGTSQRNLAMINNNIAGAYQYLNNYDSAYFYYQKAIQIDETLKDSIHLAERKSNISEILIPMGKVDLALKYLLESTEYNERNNMIDALWYNYSNLGNVYLILKDYKKSAHYYSLSYDQAQKTSTKTKIVQTLTGFSQLYQQMGNYQKALEYRMNADSINSLLVNENTNKKIAELQEKYQSQKREQQNILLASQLEKQTLQKRTLIIIALSLLLIAAIVAIALYVNNKRKNLLAQQNKLINEQKNKLAEINLEKNSLISIVSHDLSTPIINIQLWSKILTGKINTSDTSQLKALDNIKQSADYGYGLIQHILNVERAETGHHKIQLEEIALQDCVNEVKNDFTIVSGKKQIALHTRVEPGNITLLTDKVLLKRILENFVSNAIKYSNPETNVWIIAEQHSGTTSIIVKDEGPGISKDDQELLFSKYGRLSNLPTGNESSTGLGLHIVKRIVKELNGQVHVESSPGKGSAFKVVFGHGL